ncbi:MAG: hypothetical protein ACR2LQ_04670 [Acidimicrobiales bacterium]
MTDPIRERRARIAKLVEIGSRLGYGLFALAIVLFFLGLLTSFSALVTPIVACMIVGSLVLAPAIVFGYAVKAAERDDRERGL